MSDVILDALCLRLAQVNNAAAAKVMEEFKENPDRIPARAFLLVQRSVAAEALRQMQWARSEGMDGDRDKPYDVTLAPDDWQP